MAPRRYNLGKRAEAAAATRERILRAAAELFQERGIPGTSVAAVAAAADVSRATVINHFGSGDALVGAVLDQVVEELELPDARILAGAKDREDRARRFVDALCRFYERSTPWWRSFGQGFEDHPAYKAQEQTFWSNIHELARQAFGPVIEDHRVATTVWMVLHPWPYGQLRWTGLSVEESVDTLTTLALAATATTKEGRPRTTA